MEGEKDRGGRGRLGSSDSDGRKKRGEWERGGGGGCGGGGGGQVEETQYWKRQARTMREWGGRGEGGRTNQFLHFYVPSTRRTGSPQDYELHIDSHSSLCRNAGRQNTSKKPYTQNKKQKLPHNSAHNTDVSSGERVQIETEQQGTVGRGGEETRRRVEGGGGGGGVKTAGDGGGGEDISR